MQTIPDGYSTTRSQHCRVLRDENGLFDGFLLSITECQGGRQTGYIGMIRIVYILKTKSDDHNHQMEFAYGRGDNVQNAIDILTQVLTYAPSTLLGACVLLYLYDTPTEVA